MIQPFIVFAFWVTSLGTYVRLRSTLTIPPAIYTYPISQSFLYSGFVNKLRLEVAYNSWK